MQRSLLVTQQANSKTNSQGILDFSAENTKVTVLLLSEAEISEARHFDAHAP